MHARLTTEGARRFRILLEADATPSVDNVAPRFRRLPTPEALKGGSEFVVKKRRMRSVSVIVYLFI